MLKFYNFIFGLISVSLVLIASSAIIVNEKDTVLILQFGEIQKIINSPGLHFKLPFVQDSRFYDKRLVSLAPPVEKVILKNKDRFLVSSVVQYKIIDVSSFYNSVNDERIFIDRLGAIVNSTLRDVLGRVNTEDFLYKNRDAIVQEIASTVDKLVNDFGVDVVDVRIKKADLPEATIKAVYSRMRSEREKEAKEYRALGAQEARNITSRADYDVKIILANAKKSASMIIADAEGSRLKILNSAMSKNKEFAKFFIFMESYRQNINKGNTSTIVSTDSSYFKYLNA